MRHLVLLLAVFSVVVGAGWLLLPTQHPTRPVAELPHTKETNNHLVDTAVAMLQTGQLVLRMGLGADSHLLAQLNQREKKYSHCGIVVVEGGYPWVYHSIGGEDNPDERLRRDSAHFYFSPLHNTAIAVLQYGFDTTTQQRLAAQAQAFYKARPLFDLKFDLATDDALYCTEMVYKALLLATGETGFITPSVFMGKQYVGVDDLYLHPDAHMVWQTVFK